MNVIRSHQVAPEVAELFDELVAALRDTRDMLVLFCKSEAERQNSEFRESNSSIITAANAVLAKVQA